MLFKCRETLPIIKNIKVYTNHLKNVRSLIKVNNSKEYFIIKRRRHAERISNNHEFFINMLANGTPSCWCHSCEHNYERVVSGGSFHIIFKLAEIQLYNSFLRCHFRKLLHFLLKLEIKKKWNNAALHRYSYNVCSKILPL